MDVPESMLVNYGMHRPSRDDRKRFTITQNCSPGSYAIAKYRGRLYIVAMKVGFGIVITHSLYKER